MRLVYFLYYLKGAAKDKDDLVRFANFARNKTKRSKLALYLDASYSCFRYNISLEDYFYFGFYDKNKKRNDWAGTGFMYEYQLKNNPKDKRNILEDKSLFLKEYSEFVVRDWCLLPALKSEVNDILSNPFNKVVVKSSTGQAGQEVEVLKASEYNESSLVNYMKTKKYDLLESYVTQHPDLMKLSPSGLNTVRVITQVNSLGGVDILGARLRVSVNTPVDNLAAGNFALAIDVNTGTSISNGIYSDITKEDEDSHPITGIKLKGFQVPEWNKVIEVVKRAALLHPQNKSIGWDVAITESGVDLIEGNHNWCKLLYQLPVKKGLKSELVKYI